MQIVPYLGPPSDGSSRGRRLLVLLFAGLLTLGLLPPATASAAPAMLLAKDRTVVEGDSGTTTAKVKVLLTRRATRWCA